jgi:hypothetical protein
MIDQPKRGYNYVHSQHTMLATVEAQKYTPNKSYQIIMLAHAFCPALVLRWCLMRVTFFVVYCTDTNSVCWVVRRVGWADLKDKEKITCGKAILEAREILQK